jgi:hypothetical protein
MERCTLYGMMQQGAVASWVFLKFCKCYKSKMCFHISEKSIQLFCHETIFSQITLATLEERAGPMINYIFL